jgi:glycine hydroxymethyltransferase
MNVLLHGGHLTHGSPASRSGQLYKAVSYTVDPQTERLTMTDRRTGAGTNRACHRRFTSYPWTIDWPASRHRREVAYLLADIARGRYGGGGGYPSPVGYADVIFTTHKI